MFFDDPVDVGNLISGSSAFSKTSLNWTSGSSLSAAERSYPTSEVRGRSWEDPMPGRWWPRGVTTHPRSGAAAESTRLRWRRNGREELPQSEVRGGGQEELPQAQGQGCWPRGASPCQRPGAEARRSNPTPRAKGGGRRSNPTVAARAQEGLEELFHIQGQEGRRWGDTPRPR